MCVFFAWNRPFIQWKSVNVGDRHKCDWLTDWCELLSVMLMHPKVNVIVFAMLHPCGISVFSGVEFVCYPCNPPKRAPGWFNMTYNHVLYPCYVFQGHLKPLGASPGPQIIFSHFPKIGLFWAKTSPFGAPIGTQKAPGWSNMAYNHVLYPCEVFQGHLEPLGASTAALVNSSQ